MRPDWDTYFLDLARVAATRATCPRLSVGAALVRDRRVLSLGYNGAPTGHDHCTQTKPADCKLCGATIGPDITGRPMCYGCGPEIMRPDPLPNQSGPYGCLMVAGRCSRAVHAEVNAVLHAAKSGVSTAGATLYVTHRPCWDCYRLLANAGVSRAVYAADYGSAYPASGPGPQLEQLT